MTKRYTKEFKDTVVEMFNTGQYTYKELAQEYGASADSIRLQVKNAQPVGIDDQGNTVTLAEYKKLQKELKRVKEENEILKVAAVLLGKQ